MEQRITHWDILKAYDPELSEKVAAWRGEYAKREVLPLKYQELMKLIMACTLRYSPAIKAHAEAAIKLGAAKEEIFETVALSMLMGGIPSFREGATVLKDMLMNQQDSGEEK